MTLPKFDRYETLDVLGEGAMGTVYKALDPRLKREVAIKTVRPEFLRQNPGLRARFEREATVVARLVHPAIVQVYDCGGDFLVMELIRGRELKSLLREGRRFTPVEAARLLRPLAEGLDHAHAAGVIHRDIKPANLFIDDSGRPRLADFGIAKIVHEAGEGLTATGEILGTPKYMSPEQVRSEPLDGRSDQFSLAVVVYEMLSGRPPFASPTLSGVLYQIVNDPPKPLEGLDPALPPAAETALRRALAKQPAERFTACRDFAAAFSAGVMGVAGAAGLSAISAGDDTAPTLIGAIDFTAPPAAASSGTDSTLRYAPKAEAGWKPVLKKAEVIAGKVMAVVIPAVRAAGRWLMRMSRATVAFWKTRLTGPHRARWAALLAFIIVALLGLFIWAATRPPAKKKIAPASPAQNFKRSLRKWLK